MDNKSARVRAFGVLALIVIGVMIAIVMWRHQADIAARRAQAQAQLDSLIKQQEYIGNLDARYGKLTDRFNAIGDDASAAGRKRHDSSNYDVMKAQAKKELADVFTLQGMLSTMRSSLSDIASAYAEILGDSAVASFRSRADQFTELQGLSLNRHWSAIQDITDSLVRDSIVGENVGQLYDESADYDTRATTQNDEMVRLWNELDKQVQGRVDSAKSNLAAVR